MASRKSPTFKPLPSKQLAKLQHKFETSSFRELMSFTGASVSAIRAAVAGKPLRSDVRAKLVDVLS